MKAILMAVVLTLAAGNSANAQDDDCRAVDNDLDRLACFDKASGRTPTSEPGPSEGNWNVSIKTSDFEDTTDVYMSVESNDPVQCTAFGRHNTARLMIRCSENTTAVFIATDCHLASGFQGYGDMDVRVDEKPSASISMDASTDNKALGLWRGGSSIPFVKDRLLGGSTLRVRFTPFSMSPVTAVFDISGIDASIAPLREQCSW